MSDEPTVAVMPPHAEFCDWSLSDGPCNCGLDDFVAVMVAQARREGAEQIAQEIEAQRGRAWQRHLRDHPHSDATSCPRDYGVHDAFAAAANIARAALRGDA